MPSDPHPVVLARELQRRYRPDIALLEGLDVSVAAGEWVAVMGPSGCGKSTLLQLLAGLDLPNAGTIELAGRRLEALSESDRARHRRHHVGYVFQFQNLVPHLDARANVELPLRLAGTPGRTARRRALDVLAQIGIAELAGAAPATLSGGQAQRVAIARAIVNSPTVVFADEPTGALDTDATRQVLEVFRTLHAAGQTIVMVTHDHRVAAAADRVLLMRDGRFDDERVLAGDPQDPSRTTFGNLMPLEPW